MGEEGLVNCNFQRCPLVHTIMTLQIAVKRREAKSKGEKERYKHLNAEFQRIARRDKKAFLSDQCTREDGGVSGFSSSCGARGGFRTRHDEDLMEPLLRRQGSQVSMRSDP